MRTAVVTAAVLGIILVAGARPAREASAQSRGSADFQGYWMGVDPVDGGDARRSLIRRSDGKYPRRPRYDAHALRQHRSRLCQLRRWHRRRPQRDAVEFLVIKCFNNGATVRLHVTFELVDAA